MKRETTAQIWDSLWERPDSHPEWDQPSQMILEMITRETQPAAGMRFLEVGSGSGRISARLAAQGVEVSLLDFSPRAIEISRQVFARRGLAATYVQASMFDIPLQAGQYDVVFSLGVLEHWPANLQQQALGEMSRVCRPGGTLLMVVPYRWAAAYRLGKWYAERRGFWAFGPETPMTSLAGFALPGMRLAREYTIGSIDQLRFLGYLPGGKVIRKGVDFLQRNYWRLNHSLPGGWLLVSVFRKEAV